MKTMQHFGGMNKSVLAEDFISYSPYYEMHEELPELWICASICVSIEQVCIQMYAHTKVATNGEL